MIDEEQLKKALSGFRPSLPGRIATDAALIYFGIDMAETFVMEQLESYKLDIQPPAKIEAAIRYFREQFNKRELAPHDEKYKITSAYGALTVEALCQYFLGQDQETWTDKGFGL